MDTDGLRQFLVAANRAGYAGGDERQWTKETNGSTTIAFADGAWRLHDNFFGGEPYGGRAIVFLAGKPVWMMVYYGWVISEVEANPVYGVLRRALMEMPEEHPFRGPAAYSEADFTYTNAWTGDVARFTGEEHINQRERLIYTTYYSGGLVDQRSGV